MTNLLSLKFWFSIRPGDLSHISVYMYIALVVILIVVGLFIKIIVIRSKEKLHRRFLRKVQSLVVTNIIVFLVLFFLMYETIPFLSGRFWFLFWGFINIVWSYSIYKFYSKIPSQKEEREKEIAYNKYIP